MFVFFLGLALTLQVKRHVLLPPSSFSLLLHTRNPRFGASGGSSPVFLTGNFLKEVSVTSHGFSFRSPFSFLCPSICLPHSSTTPFTVFCDSFAGTWIADFYRGVLPPLSSLVPFFGFVFCCRSSLLVESAAPFFLCFFFKRFFWLYFPSSFP